MSPSNRVNYQVSYGSWKAIEFDNLDSRPGKSWNFYPGHGKSWTLMLANYVCSRAACYSGLSEIYAGKAKLYYRHSDLASPVRGNTVDDHGNHQNS